MLPPRFLSLGIPPANRPDMSCWAIAGAEGADAAAGAEGAAGAPIPGTAGAPMPGTAGAPIPGTAGAPIPMPGTAGAEEGPFGAPPDNTPPPPVCAADLSFVCVFLSRPLLPLVMSLKRASREGAPFGGPALGAPPDDNAPNPPPGGGGGGGPPNPGGGGGGGGGGAGIVVISCLWCPSLLCASNQQ
jgi:hypothetical protein